MNTNMIGYAIFFLMDKGRFSLYIISYHIGPFRAGFCFLGRPKYKHK